MKNNNCLVMIDENKYDLYLANEQDNNVYIYDKENKKINILNNTTIDVLLQINENEFLAGFVLENNKAKFAHLFRDEKSGKFTFKYNKIYNKLDNNNFLISDDVVIIREEAKTTIYNYKNNKTLELNDLQIIGTTKELENTYLNGIIPVGNLETLVMCINVKNLEFDRFYSTMQDRYISVIDGEEPYKHRLGLTLEKEVYKYAEYIEEITEYEHNNKIYNAQKKLIKNKK